MKACEIRSLLLLALGVIAGQPVACAEEVPAKRNGTVLFSKDPVVDALFHQGIRQAFDWEYERSKKTFEAIEEKDPESPVGHFFLGALTMNFIQYLDPKEIKSQEKFVEESFETAIEKSDRLLEKNPKDFIAIFFKGASHGFRGIMALQKAQFLKAAADARIAKVYMDRSVQMEPEFYDAYMGVGMYNYFMDALPAVVKLVRFILLVPPGDKAKGIHQLRLAAKRATYGSIYAKVVLAGIYRNIEKDYRKALELELDIARLHPEHPWYALERGTLYVYSMHALNRGEALYRHLLEMSTDGHPNYQGEIKFFVRYRLAKTRYFNLKPQEAIADLEQLLKEKPTEPKEALPAIHLLLGEIYLRLGEKELGMQHLKQVMAFPDSRTYRQERMDNRIIIPSQPSFHELAKRLKSKFGTKAASSTYRLVTKGFAQLRKGKLEDAWGSFSLALKMKAGSQLALFGLGEVAARQKEWRRAVEAFDKLSSLVQSNPSWLLREACLRAGLIYDRLGQRPVAVRHYKKAQKVRGGNDFHGRLAEKAAKDPQAWKTISWPEI